MSKYNPEPDLKLQVKISLNTVTLSRKWREDMEWDKLHTYYLQACEPFDFGRTSFVSANIMNAISAEMERGYYLAEVIHE